MDVANLRIIMSLAGANSPEATILFRLERFAYVSPRKVQHFLHMSLGAAPLAARVAPVTDASGDAGGAIR
jgi:hypothetical protein